MMSSKKGVVVPIFGIVMAVIVLLVLIFMLPGMLLFIKWMFSSGPAIGPIGIFAIGIFVVLYLRKQVI